MLLPPPSLSLSLSFLSLSLSLSCVLPQHPNSLAAQGGFGWAELYFVLGSGCSGDGSVVVLPDHPDYYFGPSAPPPPPPAPRAKPQASHPIFYMAPGVSVGERVRLHLFEPRYRLLAKRVWATDRTFVYCARAPLSAAGESAFNLPYDQEPASDGCVAVVLDEATFGPDGQADVWGRATEAVSLDSALLEPQTGGLFSTTTPIGGGGVGGVGGSISAVAERPLPDPLATVPTRGANLGGGSGGLGDVYGDAPFDSSPPPTRRGARAFGLLATFAAAVLVGLIMASWLCARPRKPPMRFCPPPPKPPKRSRKAPKVVMVAAVPGFADTVVAVPTAMPV